MQTQYIIAKFQRQLRDAVIAGATDEALARTRKRIEQLQEQAQREAVRAAHFNSIRTQAAKIVAQQREAAAAERKEARTQAKLAESARQSRSIELVALLQSFHESKKSGRKSDVKLRNAAYNELKEIDPKSWYFS